MAEREIESDSSGDYADASENPIWYSDEMYGITKDMIQRNKELLADRLQDTKYGILDKLIANGGLTYQETIEIDKCSTNPCDKIRKLIDVILENNVLTQFITALVDTDQKHLVNYLRGNGVFNAEFGGDWPLGQDRIRQLDINREYLIDKMDTLDSGLIYKLRSAKVISQRQYSFIFHEKNPCEVNSILLDVIRRQSLKHYKDTIVCLNESKQLHIAEILEKTGVIQQIHVSQKGDPEIVNKTEDALSNRFADSLRDLSIEEAQRVLEMTQLKIFAAKKTKSIYLYAYTETLEELMALHNLLVTGAVKTIVETLFNKLVPRRDPIVVSYTYSEEEFDKCKSYFEGYNTADRSSIEEPKSTEAALMDTEIQKLRESKVTPEVFRVNLERHRVFVEGRMDPDHGLVDRLLETDAIDYNQVQIICAEKVAFIKNRKILDIILDGNTSEKIEKLGEALRYTKQQHLFNYVEANGVYKKQYAGNWPLSERETFIIDKNREYLTEKIDTEGGLLANMRKHKIITQWQEESVSKQPGRYQRNTALLGIIRRGSLSEYKNTIDRLMETKQEHIANILIEAGAPAQIHSKATVKADQPIADEGEAKLSKIDYILQKMTPEEKVRLAERVQQKMLGLHDAPVSESVASSHPSPSAGSLGKQGTPKNRRGMAEGGEQELPGIGSKTASRISSFPGHGSDEENMNNVRHLLVERMDPDFGLIDKLVQLKALTFPEAARIKKERLIFDRNEKLLELIFSKMKHQALLTALTDTGQKHLFNLVKGNGEYRPEYGSVWPLREREVQILDENQFNLVEIIAPWDLITRMFSKEVITNRQQRYINGLQNDTDKAEALLGVLRRGSEECYLKTVLCLQESNQSDVAEILLDGGVLAQVHVSYEGDAEQVNVEEDHLVEALEALLQNTSLPQYQRIRERLDLQIMRTRKGF